jgi:hypothetical protein
MPMYAGTRPTAARLALGFVGGFLSTLVFHQLSLLFLASIGFVRANVYVMNPVPPFGVPQVISLAFWGGLWGIVFALAEGSFPVGPGYWISAFVFGAVAPTLVAWFVVAGLKGQPIAAGWQPFRMLTGLIINGAWGVGTGLFLTATGARRRARLGASVPLQRAA